MLDMVTYAAGLVSNARAVDPLLDKVRAISAGLGPGQQPQPGQIRTLVHVYLALAEYLGTKEPLRAFSKEELRAHMTPELLAQVEQMQLTDKEGHG